MAIALTKIKKELLSKINEKDAVEVEKVERYVSLIDILRKLQSTVKDEGTTKVTINGPQEFTKAHPALSEISKINSQLISLEKSFNFIVHSVPPQDDKKDDTRAKLT